MVKKTLENLEKIALQDLKYGDKLKNVENEKQTLHDLEYGEKTEKHGKLENHTVGS